MEAMGYVAAHESASVVGERRQLFLWPVEGIRISLYIRLHSALWRMFRLNALQLKDTIPPDLDAMTIVNSSEDLGETT